MHGQYDTRHRFDLLTQSTILELAVFAQWFTISYMTVYESYNTVMHIIEQIHRTVM